MGSEMSLKFYLESKNDGEKVEEYLAKMFKYSDDEIKASLTAKDVLIRKTANTIKKLRKNKQISISDGANAEQLGGEHGSVVNTILKMVKRIFNTDIKKTSTSKTDLLIGNKKISVKYGTSQLMSGKMML